MMTKKHFEKIASIFKEDNVSWRVELELNTYNRLAHKMADFFATENPQFNKEKFLQACGVSA